ncbi:TlpA family protein disulfide reductase [Desertivirga arenae]|uniref:TlpA family protein disulfide reductase n=1 Tax=Desertivirga arenae TaxID=2810309 RepID=UPI001A96173E|nr:TlpA disulfide reductase family protein [Pedobacter sp. SYSU D00823]
MQTKFLATEKNSYLLLEKLNNDKDPKFETSVKPLYLWVKAKQTSDSKSLIKLSQVFKKLNTAYWIDGNAGRYQLLLSQMLTKKGEIDEGKILLDDAIQKLEKLNADTLNKYRMAHRNLLAGAYYIQYLEDHKRGNSNSLSFLSKAAEYSPKSAKEMAHESFYDRVFLNTKEGYRKEFVEKLFESGNRDEALKVFALHLNSNPDELEDMKQLYQKNFPDNSFSTFLSERMISSWTDAPDFTLKDLKGEEHSLKDFKNKWLVLDFWGTWCGPCRQEMPDLNKFNLAIKEGKHPDVNFLSIACSDTPESVGNYLKANNFIIPAVMSNNLIERDYKVNGYPSKYIVTPDGKMLNIKFGKDWQAILNSFISNYKRD